MVRVTIYNEFQHERNEERIRRVYPEGIHMCLKRFLESDDIKVTTITLDDVKNGISDELLHDTDVMIWWGHMAHQLVPDEVAVKVQQEVLRGMGMIFLHSGHHSKPFRLLMGTTCNLSWREDGDYERADRYVHFCEACNTAFSPQLRNYQVRYVANVMEAIYKHDEARYARLLKIACAGAVILLGLVAWLLLRQKRRRPQA